jgi:hypothetical protein
MMDGAARDYRDYTESCKKTLDAAPVEIDSVEGWRRRLRRHSFDPVEAQAVRIHIQAANRGAQARVFEVRCYA